MEKKISFFLLLSFATMSYGGGRSVEELEKKQWGRHHNDCVATLERAGLTHSYAIDRLGKAVQAKKCEQLTVLLEGLAMPQDTVDRAEECCQVLLALKKLHSIK